MRYEVITSLTPEEVIEDALHYFGPGSTGLVLTSQTSQGVVFQGGGGHVAIQVQQGVPITVDIETREWITRYVNLWDVSADAVGGQSGGSVGQNRPRQKGEHQSRKSPFSRFWTIEGRTITAVRGASAM